jgi:hypothetical protein
MLKRSLLELQRRHLSLFAPSGAAGTPKTEQGMNLRLNPNCQWCAAATPLPLPYLNTAVPRWGLVAQQAA